MTPKSHETPQGTTPEHPKDSPGPAYEVPDRFGENGEIKKKIRLVAKLFEHRAKFRALIFTCAPRAQKCHTLRTQKCARRRRRRAHFCALPVSRFCARICQLAHEIWHGVQIIWPPTVTLSTQKRTRLKVLLQHPKTKRTRARALARPISHNILPLEPSSSQRHYAFLIDTVGGQII